MSRGTYLEYNNAMHFCNMCMSISCENPCMDWFWIDHAFNLIPKMTGQRSMGGQPGWMKYGGVKSACGSQTWLSPNIPKGWPPNCKFSQPQKGCIFFSDQWSNCNWWRRFLRSKCVSDPRHYHAKILTSNLACADWMLRNHHWLGLRTLYRLWFIVSHS